MSYAATLRTAWKGIASARSKPRFTVVSTFSGCGGSSLGYRLAGGKSLLAVEWDANAAETYRLNFPGTEVYHGDIAKLTGAEALRRAGLKKGELDILDGSPPCQGYADCYYDSTQQMRLRYEDTMCRFFDGKRVSALVDDKILLILDTAHADYNSDYIFNQQRSILCPR